uniref:Uncharacterized protein n=1 Tax=Virgibacillus oceani TaxID=1479511 RepID=A0A917LXR8_9BACI|nr:hypothetical protein GCM10011398_06960 [Virgibacillus oceani]
MDNALRLLKVKNPSYPISFDIKDANGYKKRHGISSDAELVEICYTFLDVVKGCRLLCQSLRK